MVVGYAAYYILGHHTIELATLECCTLQLGAVIVIGAPLLTCGTSMYIVAPLWILQHHY